MVAAISSSVPPIIAAIPPVPTGILSCMALDRILSNSTESLKLRDLLATNAEYSPREWPATQ